MTMLCAQAVYTDAVMRVPWPCLDRGVNGVKGVKGGTFYF
jgi:hypothetical protein